MNVYRLILNILSDPETISTGITGDITGEKCAVVRKNRDGTFIPLWFSAGIPWWLHFVIPAAVKADTSNEPLYITSTNIGDDDPDSWIDRNEENVIPAGFTSDQLAVEYDVRDKTIYTASITKNSRDRIIDSFNGKTDVMSIIPALGGLAEIYHGILRKPFVMWKCSSTGSILACSENGKITGIVNGWPDIDDIKENDNAALEFIINTVRSFTDDKKTTIVTVGFNPENVRLNDNIDLVKSPEVKNVPDSFTEPYSIACSSESSINFVPFDQSVKLRKILEKWRKTVVWIRMIGLTGLLIFAATGIIFTGLSVFERIKSSEIDEIKTRAHSVTNSRNTRDSLVNEIKRSGVVTGKDSRITLLLSDMQGYFPEGMWAEEISVREQNDMKWQISIVALAKQTAQIGMFMKNLRDAGCMTDIRMVYSEQVKMKTNDKVTRCRVECIWTQNGKDAAVAILKKIGDK